MKPADNTFDKHRNQVIYANKIAKMRKSGSLSVVKSRVLGSVSSGSVVLYEVRDYPAS